MDQEDPIEKRVTQNTRRLIRLYMGLRQILLLLTIPVSLPKVPDTAAEMVAAVQNARELMDEEPMDNDLTGLLEAVLLDWLNAYELGALIQEAGAAPWRIDAMEAALDRSSEFAKVAAELLGTILGNE
jgi:hypothetical protein